jgi:hypothetical protein
MKTIPCFFGIVVILAEVTPSASKSLAGRYGGENGGANVNLPCLILTFSKFEQSRRADYLNSEGPKGNTKKCDEEAAEFHTLL